MRAFAVLAFAAPAVALDNGVGLTPAMGYNTWDDFRCGGINVSNIQRVADAMVANGLQKAGYQYVNIDDCWAVSRDPATNVIVEDPHAFPHGMKAVADYVHSKGLKFGIYTDRGTKTCEGRPGSQGHETIDAQTYARWGVDFLKEDSCNAPTDHDDAFKQYGLMRDALNATGRPVYFSICGWSDWYAPPPAGAALGNSWRFSYDVNDWNSAIGLAILPSTALAKYAGPGGWNDPDALLGSSPGTAVHMTQTESRTQFTLWAMMAAPLSIGAGVVDISAYDLETYTNAEVIAVDQDPLGKQGGVVQTLGNCEGESPLWGDRSRSGRRARSSVTGSCTAPPDCQQVWLRQLHDGYAVAFVNYTLPGAPRVGASKGTINLAPCNASDDAQLWDVTTSGLLSRFQSAANGQGCWEVPGCGYSAGTSINTNFGCKAIPPARGIADGCCFNMAWHVNANGTITSGLGGLCVEVGGSGGALAICNGSKAQRWTLRGAKGKQQIVSGENGECVTNPSNGELAPDPRAAELVFDVKASLGWDAARVRDLWAHEDLGVQSKIAVALRGNSDSKVFKLTRASAELLV